MANQIRDSEWSDEHDGLVCVKCDDPTCSGCVPVINGATGEPYVIPGFGIVRW